MGLTDKSESLAGGGATISTVGEGSSPPSPAALLTVNVNIKRNPSLKKLLKLPIFGGGGSGGKYVLLMLFRCWHGHCLSFSTDNVDDETCGCSDAQLRVRDR